jgi:hypothetical protein
VKINVETIPHQQHRYNTVGDYWMDPSGTLQIRISELGLDHELPILIHELVEWYLCQKRGVRLEDIDSFDRVFELERSLGRHTNEEPGDSPDAPYATEHRFAENIERQVVQEAGLRWDEYEAHISEDWLKPDSVHDSLRKLTS